MTPSARIQGAIELLDFMETSSAPADRASAAFFRNRRYIGAKDRKEIIEHVYDVLRARARLTWHLRLASPSPRFLIIAKLLLIDRWSVDRLSGSFDGGQYRPATLTTEERNVARRFEGHELSTSDQPEDVALELPRWLLPKLKFALGSQWQEEAAALRDEALVDLRINRLKGKREEIAEILKNQEIDIQPTPFSPLGLRLSSRINLPRLDLFQNGTIEVQDEGSQLIALMLGAKPGERIVDFCAGAGGKTLAIAAEMQNKGKIVATDTLKGRLERSSTRLARAGVFNVERRALTSERDPWVKKHVGSFDRVLIDAPCSGVGTWRRNPDQKWRLHPDDIPRLVELQKNILDSAQRLIRPGGYLLYATCSLLPEENEGHIPGFLADHPDFSLVSLKEQWKSILSSEPPFAQSWMRLTPYRHHCDGFFAALFMRSPFQVRRAKANDASSIASIHEAGWNRAYHHICTPEQLAEMSAAKRLAFWEKMVSNPEQLILIAFQGEKPVGFIHGGPIKPHDIREGSLDGYENEIYSLHCRAEIENRGLGRLLLKKAWQEFQRQNKEGQGKEGLMLWAFRDNPFRTFYEKVGGEIIAKGTDDGIPDIAYGWKEGILSHAS